MLGFSGHSSLFCLCLLWVRVARWERTQHHAFWAVFVTGQPRIPSLHKTNMAESENSNCHRFPSIIDPNALLGKWVPLKLERNYETIRLGKIQFVPFKQSYDNFGKFKLPKFLYAKSRLCGKFARYSSFIHFPKLHFLASCNFSWQETMTWC